MLNEVTIVTGLRRFNVLFVDAEDGVVFYEVHTKPLDDANFIAVIDEWNKKFTEYLLKGLTVNGVCHKNPVIQTYVTNVKLPRQLTFDCSS